MVGTDCMYLHMTSDVSLVLILEGAAGDMTFPDSVPLNALLAGDAVRDLLLQRMLHRRAVTADRGVHVLKAIGTSMSHPSLLRVDYEATCEALT